MLRFGITEGIIIAGIFIVLAIGVGIAIAASSKK
jgi:hypothetical protein